MQGQLTDELVMGKPQAYGGTRVFPLSGPAPERPLGYQVLDEALANRTLSVSEVSQDGQVPDLLVINSGDKPVLMLDGEELAGAKQNRVLNATILVASKTQLVVPVSCTERGRWRYSSPHFASSGHVMSAKARAQKNLSVSCFLSHEATYKSDQDLVWQNIEMLNEQSGSHGSSTRAMADAFAARKASLNEAASAFSLVEGQTGFLFASEDKVIGLDFLSEAAAFARVFPKLLRSYLMEALAMPGPLCAAPVDGEAKARDFLAKALAGEPKRFKSVGLGEDLRYEGTDITGSVLAVDGQLVHGAFFSMDASDSQRRMAIASMRRRYRTYLGLE